MPISERSSDYRWTLVVPLPDGTPDDPYDPDALAQSLRELADRVETNDLPPTGELWGRTGRLIGHGDLVEPNASADKMHELEAEIARLKHGGGILDSIWDRVDSMWERRRADRAQREE